MAEDASTEAFAAAMTDTLQRDQRERVARGRAIADAFDWTRIGGRILDVLQTAAGHPARLTGSAEKAVA